MNIALVRKNNHLKQSDMAEFLGVSRSFISQMESGYSPVPQWVNDKIMSNDDWVFPDEAMKDVEVKELKELSDETPGTTIIHTSFLADDFYRELKERIKYLEEQNKSYFELIKTLTQK